MTLLYRTVTLKWPPHSKRHTETETQPLAGHEAGMQVIRPYYAGHQALLCWLHRSQRYLSLDTYRAAASSCSADPTLLSEKCLNIDGLGKKAHHSSNLP